MRNVFFGLLAVGLGGFILYYTHTQPGKPELGYIVGAVIVVAGLDHMFRRGPQSRGREIVEGFVALGLAGWQLYRYLQHPPQASGPYAQGRQTGALVFIALFGLFGLYKLLKGRG